MSTTIDQKVVEMRFDNKQFESGVSTTMSTLDKFKQKLNLTGASKGLEEISSSAKKVDMSGLGKSVETVSAKFSALQVMGVTALANITNSAVNAGKRLLSSFTVEPIRTGFNEYELKMGSIQTIMASTGESLEKVNGYLDELNKYSDKTIYSFSDMTNNIGKFTNAGVKLEDAVLAIKGISNEAAVSGANANEASRAMYNFSQALSAGYVKLIDWKSIENANMATVEFKQQLIESAVACGTLTKTADGLYSTGKRNISATLNFNDSLTDQWMTTEVLTRTLANYATDVREMTDAEREAYEEKLRGQGYTDEQIKKIEELGKKAYDSAQDVKTFSMMMDTLKEAAQSGWARTWELIFGDFEQGKQLWTNLSKFFGNIIDGMSDARNKLLESALGKGFTALIDKVKNITDPIKKSADSIKAVTDSVKDYAKVVDEIIVGKWGNGQSRWDKLTEAGYDWAHAQNLVNEKLGNAKRHTTDYAEAQEKVADAQDKTTESTTELTEADKEHLKKLIGLNDVALKAVEYTDEQIAAFNELRITAEKLGIPLDEFIDNLDEIDGRWLLINSFKNAGKGLVAVFNAMSEAWRKVFHGDATDEEILQKKADMIFNIIAALHKFSAKLIPTDETIKNITRTFKGLFAVLDIIRTIAGGGIKIAFKILNKILSAFDMNVLELTGDVGDMLVKFRDWLFENNSVVKSIDKLIDKIPGAIEAVSEWINMIKKLDGVGHLVESISRLLRGIASIKIGNLGIFDKIVSAIEKLTGIDLTSTGENIFESLIKGLAGGALKVIDVVTEVASNLIDTFCDILEIHSPSKVFIAIGGFIIAGLLLGLKEGFISVPSTLQDLGMNMLEVVKNFVSVIINYVKNIEWDKILALGISVSMVWFVKKVGDALSGIASAFEGFGDILENVAYATKSFGKLLKGISWDFKAKAIQKLAITLAILVGAVLLLVKVGGDDIGKLWNAVGIIGALALILVGLAWAMNKLSDASVSYEKGKLNIDGIKQSLTTIGIALLLMGATVKLIGSMDLGQAIQGFAGVIVLVGVLVGVLAAYGQLVKGKAAQNIDKAGKMIFKLSLSLLLMVGVCKLVGKLSPGEMKKGAAFAAGFTVFVLALTAISKLSGKKIDKLGGMMINISIAMALMVGVTKLISTLSPLEIIQGAAFASGFVVFVGLLGLATRAAGKDVPKLGGLLLSISFSMMLMVGVCKLVGKLSPDEMIKGAAFAAGFLVFVGILTKILKIGNDQKMAKVALTILSLSVAIGILAGVSILLGLIDTKDLIKGVAAVTVLGTIMTVMIKATTKARKVKGELVVLTVAVAVMAAAVAGLSMIDDKKLAGAVLAMSTLMAVFAIVIRSAKDVKGSLGTLLVMTVAIGVLASAIALLSTLNPETSLKNVAALSILMLTMAGVMRIISGMNSETKKTLGGVLALAALAVPMYLFVQVLKQMSGIENAVTNVLVLGGLMTVMTALLAALSFIGKAGLKAVAGVALLTAMWIPMMVFIDIIKRISGIEVATNNVILLASLMTVMTVLLGVLTIIGFGVPFAFAGVALLTAMWLPMMTFIGIIKRISGIDIAVDNVMLLMNMMTIMTGLLTQLAIIGPFALIGVAAMQGLILLIGELGIMATAVGALVEKFPSLQKFLDTGIPVLEQLAEGLGTMIGKFIGGIGEGLGDSLVQIGTDITKFMGSLKEAAATAEGIKGSSFDGVKQLMEALLGVGLTSVSMSISDVFTKAIGNKTVIEKFKEDGIAFFKAFKAISNEARGFTFPKDFSVDGLKTLILAISSIGAISIGTTLTDMFLTKIGDKTAMEKFKEDGKAFFVAIKEISSEMVGFTFPEDFSVEGLTMLLDSLKTVATSMTDISLADIFTKMVDDKTAMEKFKEDGKVFFKAIKAISLEMTGFTFPEDFSVKGLTTLLDALKDVGNSMIGLSIAGIFASIGGDKTAMEKFKTDGAAFFKAIKAISLEMTGFTFPADFSQEGLSKLFETLKSVGSYTRGASWSDIFTLGGTTMEKFQTDGVTFFKTLKEMSTEASGINMAAFTIAETAIGKIKAVIASVDGIDYSGVKEFTGIGTGGFGADGPMHDIAEALKDFGDTVVGINLESMTTSITAANKLKTLISSLVNLDTSGIVNFKPKDIGKEMKNYSKQVEDIDPGVVSSSISSAKNLAALIRSLVDLDTSGISSFQVKSIGDKMKAYSDSVSGIDSGAISSSISAANRLKVLINSLANIDTSGVGPFKSAIESLGKIQIGNIVSVFNDTTAQLTNVGSNLITAIANGMRSKQAVLTGTTSSMTNILVSQLRSTTSTYSSIGATLMSNLANGMRSRQTTVIGISSSTITVLVNQLRSNASVFNSAGVALMTNLASGILSQRGTVINSATSALASAVSSVNSYYGSFYSAGGYLVDGFANGISANSYKAAAQARAMALAAKKAAEEALGIESPSKVFYAVGEYTVQGFVNALTDHESEVYSIGYDMAEYARKGLSDAISQIQNVANSDTDYQPTIKPVLDLSDVESGAAAISKLFSGNESVGVSANVDSISSTMNQKNQNGSNKEVVSAIDGLRKDIKNIKSVTYSVNNVTYDDGSNVSKAVTDLVRAARIERRI